MKIVLKEDLEIDKPSDEFIKWIKDQLIIDNPEYAKKVQMGFWTGNTPRKIALFKKIDGVYHLPYGTLSFMPDYLIGDFDEILDHTINTTVVNYAGNLNLRWYQVKEVNEMTQHRCGILKAPPGSGKTQAALGILQRLGKKALWIVHTKDLLKQSYDRAHECFPYLRLGTITDGHVDIGELTFATIQTLANADIQHNDLWDVVIVDECHRVAGTPTNYTMYSKVLNKLCSEYKYGLTATPHRSDGMEKAMFSLLGKVACEIQEEEISGYTMPVTISPESVFFPITENCLGTDGMLNYQRYISELIADMDRNLLITERVVENEGRPCLILSSRINHLKTLFKLLPDKMQKDAVLITGSTKKEARNKAIEDMRTGKKLYLFASYNLAKEGLDIPCLENLFLVTPQKDSAVIEQAIGRIARTSEGKHQPVAYDFVENNGFGRKQYKARCRVYKKKGWKVI